MTIAKNILRMYESTQDGIKDKIKENDEWDKLAKQIHVLVTAEMQLRRKAEAIYDEAKEKWKRRTGNKEVIHSSFRASPEYEEYKKKTAPIVKEIESKSKEAAKLEKQQKAITKKNMQQKDQKDAEDIKSDTNTNYKGLPDLEKEAKRIASTLLRDGFDPDPDEWGNVFADSTGDTLDKIDKSVKSDVRDKYMRKLELKVKSLIKGKKHPGLDEELVPFVEVKLAESVLKLVEWDH